MSSAWWLFLLTTNSGLILDSVLMPSLPDYVKVVLGGPLNSEELMMLPHDWTDCKLWLVYMDNLRYTVPLGTTDDLTNRDVGRYVGSSTAAKGGCMRLQIRDRASKGRGTLYP